MNKLTRFIKNRTALAVVVLAAMLQPLAAPVFVQADTSVHSEAKVSLTFDDGFASTYTTALPILEKYGLDATTFVTTSFIGKRDYLTWSQVRSMQNDYGWEIGSHTVGHPELPLLSTRQIANELKTSKNTLTAQGLNVTSFASPYGAYDNRVIAEAMKYYNLHRGFWDRDTMNSYPYNRSTIRVQSIQEGVTVNQIKQWIDEAKTQKQWLVLVLHEVKPTADPSYEYTTTTQDLTDIAAYVASSGVKNVRMDHMLETSKANVLPNGSFEQGIATGWTTDNSRQVTLNTGSNGAYPSAVQSIRMSGTQSAIHLFSPRITATTSAYRVEFLANANGLTGGEVGLYIDEFDANGNWTSGQWKGMVAAGSTDVLETMYAPSSAEVASFSLQTYVTGGSRGSAYVDGYLVIPDGAGRLTPSPTPSPTPTPIPVPAVNLVANGSFENLNSSWAASWIRDNDQSVFVDTTSQGNHLANSLAVGNTGTSAAHAFSDRVNVSPSIQYRWSQYVRSTHTTGEFGFYIDEYNATGDWISGQWLGMVEPGFAGEKVLDYRPTSSNVAAIALQYYATLGMGGQVFVDSVVLVDAATGATVVTQEPTTSPSPRPTPIPTPTATVTPTPTPTPVSNPQTSQSLSELLGSLAKQFGR